MKKSNTDILNHVKSIITEKKNEKPHKLSNANLDAVEIEKVQEQNIDMQIDNEIKKWIQLNAEKICKEIVKEEVKKIFK
tara:strand:+ start:272 stop:508 length:237 start_codon:yes stop_codon:yes gene_type:complete